MGSCNSIRDKRCCTRHDVRAGDLLMSWLINNTRHSIVWIGWRFSMRINRRINVNSLMCSFYLKNLRRFFEGGFFRRCRVHTRFASTIAKVWFRWRQFPTCIATSLNSSSHSSFTLLYFNISLSFSVFFRKQLLFFFISAIRRVRSRSRTALSESSKCSVTLPNITRHSVRENSCREIVRNFTSASVP